MPTKLYERLEKEPQANVTIFLVDDGEGIRVAMSFGHGDALVGNKSYADKKCAVDAANELKKSLVLALGEGPEALVN